MELEDTHVVQVYNSLGRKRNERQKAHIGRLDDNLQMRGIKNKQLDKWLVDDTSVKGIKNKWLHETFLDNLRVKGIKNKRLEKLAGERSSCAERRASRRRSNKSTDRKHIPGDLTIISVSRGSKTRRWTSGGLMMFLHSGEGIKNKALDKRWSDDVSALKAELAQKDHEI
ncbi:hypothetical protein V8E51_013783 [Hyaloscypha variabilis]